MNGKTPFPNFPVLFITTTHPGWGYGHARRVISLVKEFSRSQWHCEVVDVVFEKKNEPCPDLLDTQFPSTTTNPSNIKWPITFNVIRSLSAFHDWITGKFFSLVVIDRREPPPTIIEKIKALGDIPIVAFDIRANIPQPKKTRNHNLVAHLKALGKITYVINSIPSLENNWANLNGLCYLYLPRNINPSHPTPQKKTHKKIKSDKREMLLYLGEFSNREYITEAITQVGDYIISIESKQIEKSSQKKGNDQETLITVITSEKNFDIVKTQLNRISDSFPQKISYRLLTFNPNGIDWTGITILFVHFGLMGIEGIRKGIPTYFLEPTPYHRQLVQHYFPQMLLSQAIIKKKVIERKAHIENIGNKHKQIIKILKEFALSSNLGKSQNRQRKEVDSQKCDLCYGNLSIKQRQSWMNLSQCCDCKSYHLQPFFSISTSSEDGRRLWDAPQENYDMDYFIGEYEKSYGRSYRDDEVVIKGFARNRMEMIEHLIKEKKNRKQNRLLDVGCAYGFFLDIAKELNYDTYGVDISKHAGKQINSHHFIRGDFLEKSTLQSWLNEGILFDVITLWYVIEHFPNIASVIKRVSSIQAPGGILGLSTPNARGLTSRIQQEKFLTSSPTDHYYIFSIKGLKKKLSKFGYTYAGFRAGGIHYRRFQEACPHFFWIPKILYQKWAAWTNLGDTMEVYFIKR